MPFICTSFDEEDARKDSALLEKVGFQVRGASHCGVDSSVCEDASTAEGCKGGLEAAKRDGCAEGSGEGENVFGSRLMERSRDDKNRLIRCNARILRVIT